MFTVTPASRDALLDFNAAAAAPNHQDRQARPAAPLTVNAFLSRNEIATAGELLRAGPAINLVPLPPPAMMSLANDVLAATMVSATEAGFDVIAAETVPQTELIDRLRRLDHNPTVVVSATRSVRQQRFLARAAEGPVLALPGGLAPKGHAVVSAADAWVCAGPVARALSATHLVIVGRRTTEGDAGARMAERLGMQVEMILTTAPDALKTIVEELDGVLVATDCGTRLRRGPLGQSLEQGRPCLMVPAHGARR